jgi:hypothetical protein
MVISLLPCIFTFSSFSCASILSGYFYESFALSNEGSSDRMGRDRLNCSKLKVKIIPKESQRGLALDGELRLAQIKCSAIFCPTFF